MARNRRGFTLVELLVVIGIIGLLLSILLVALGRAREHAKSAVCMSNLRQMGTALQLYVGEYKYYPGCYCLDGGQPYAIWPTRLRQMMNLGTIGSGVKVFWCPSQDKDYQWAPTFGSGPGNATALTGFGYQPGESLLLRDSVKFSYGYNDWGMGSPTSLAYMRGLGGDIRSPPSQNSELPVGRVKAASEMIAIACMTARSDWNFNLDPRDPKQYPSDIHRGGSNVLFCDSHVLWFLQKDLVMPADDWNWPMNRNWNNDNEAHNGN